ncbi:MAG TPA: LysM peptidoglycan-binding domain-containing protein [Acidimicrobiales bacterium]|nr:LysM peptidoglycan-binding domain-containing protein [Acidimicrobiales bacterium]
MSAADAASMASMVSAYIQVLPPGFGTIVFPYNPDEYTIKKEASWHHTPQPAADSGGTPQFQGTKAQTMDVKILLDQFGLPPNPPEEAIAILKQAMAPTPESKALQDSKPPTVMYGWGTNIIMEEAYITALSITYKRFLLGNPVLAEVVVSLEAVPSVLPGTNPTSGGLTTRRSHTVVEGDTLASIAFAEYKNPNRWRALAVANGIDDPMRLRPGTVLLVPDPAEAEAIG